MQVQRRTIVDKNKKKVRFILSLFFSNNCGVDAFFILIPWKVLSENNCSLKKKNGFVQHSYEKDVQNFNRAHGGNSHGESKPARIGW